MLRPGEGKRTTRVALIALAWMAATSLGDDVAQSVFVSRAGAEALPRMFLFKGLLDVLAAAIYVPLARGRTPSHVLVVALTIYTVTVSGAQLLVSGGGGTWTAYTLYVGHEAAWTVITIHWGVYILDAFDASQARRLFPLLFAVGTLGKIGGGALLSVLAGPVGALNLLWVCVGLAVAAMALSIGRRRAEHAARPALPEDHDAPLPDVDPDPDPSPAPSNLWSAWRSAVRSPLVRAIAASTAAMVLVRYGLQIVALSEIEAHFLGDEDEIARFLGLFTAVANSVAIALALIAVPRVLHYLGPRFANLLYAAVTVGTYALLVAIPSLWTAAVARFTHQQFKDAVKTPLSTLFYGAEQASARGPARAFIFGAIIPAATIVTALTFEAAPDANTVAWIGLGAAIVFAAACAVQNQRWRARLVELLSWKLQRGPAPDATRLAAARNILTEACPEPSRRDEIARGLASPDPRLQAVAEEVLAETTPRRQAHEIAQRVRGALE